MPPLSQSRDVWRKSSYSNGTGGSCVEVAALSRKDGHGSPDRMEILPFTDLKRGPDQQVAVRDSKDPYGPILAIDLREWLVFVGAIKSSRINTI
jgi:hypothetical protein